MSTNSEMLLGELLEKGEIEIKTGPFGTQLKASEYVHSGTPVINVRNIGLGNLRAEKLEYVPIFVAERLRSHKLMPCDIVFGRKGAVERHLFVGHEQDGWLQGSDCIRVRCKTSRLHARFLSYYLLTDDHKKWIQGQSSHGATMATLNQGIIERISIPSIDVGAQTRIANILSRYDDLIEVNQRRIAILEDMARRLFDEWFVRCRYPGHADVALVEVEDVIRPFDWELKRLGTILSLDYGKALKSDDRQPGSVPVFGSSGIVGMHNIALVNGPGIIVGRKGNVGSVHWSTSDFYPIDTVFFVRTELPLRWIFQLLKRQTFLNSDAAVPGLNREQAYSIEVFLPPRPLLDRYAVCAEPLHREAELLDQANSRLRAARDLLLPKLISGEIELGKAEQQFAQAAE